MCGVSPPRRSSSRIRSGSWIRWPGARPGRSVSSVMRVARSGRRARSKGNSLPSEDRSTRWPSLLPLVRRGSFSPHGPIAPAGRDDGPRPRGAAHRGRRPPGAATDSRRHWRGGGGERSQCRDWKAVLIDLALPGLDSRSAPPVTDPGEPGASRYAGGRRAPPHCACPHPHAGQQAAGGAAPRHFSVDPAAQDSAVPARVRGGAESIARLTAKGGPESA